VPRNAHRSSARLRMHRDKRSGDFSTAPTDKPSSCASWLSKCRYPYGRRLQDTNSSMKPDYELMKPPLFLSVLKIMAQFSVRCKTFNDVHLNGRLSASSSCSSQTCGTRHADIRTKSAAAWVALYTLVSEAEKNATFYSRPGDFSRQQSFSGCKPSTRQRCI
jgi:hypothetical protein